MEKLGLGEGSTEKLVQPDALENRVHFAPSQAEMESMLGLIMHGPLGPKQESIITMLVGLIDHARPSVSMPTKWPSCLDK